MTDKQFVLQAANEGAHKLAMPGKYAEDQEILRIPVALAMTKLLQCLPDQALKQNLPT